MTLMKLKTLEDYYYDALLESNLISICLHHLLSVGETWIVRTVAKNYKHRTNGIAFYHSIHNESRYHFYGFGAPVI